MALFLTNTLPSQTKSLHFLNLARAVEKAPKSSHITPILKSLHWCKVNKRIEYKINFLHLPTKFLQPVNLAILTILSLFCYQGSWQSRGDCGN